MFEGPKITSMSLLMMSDPHLRRHLDLLLVEMPFDLMVSTKPENRPSIGNCLSNSGEIRLLLMEEI